MITVLPEKDTDFLKRLYSDNNLEFNVFSGGVTARFGDEVLGYCLYTLEPDRFTVHIIKPNDDIMLADGILRSALHIAAERSIMNTYYSDTVLLSFLEKTDFIKDKTEKTLDIDKLFGGCHCGK